jgi:putative heme transporter
VGTATPGAAPPQAGAPRARLGDRVERAIEDRADVEHAIERAEAQPTPRRKLLRRAVWLGITAVSLYLVFPSVLDVLGSWRDLSRFSWSWLAVMAALQLATLACLWALQFLAMRAQSWYPVITSQLAGNALSKIAPGGGAVGAALQYRMLVQAGLRQATVVAGLTAVSLLTFAAVLALPVFAVPAIVRGTADRNLVEATIVGAAVFLALFAVGAVCLVFDEPLRWVGRLIQRVRNRLRRRHAEPLTGLPSRLLRERDRILATLGPRWKRALVATIGRWAFDYATLLGALAAVGSHPKPALVLLAFCAAQILAQIPITPGGLGFVEAGLTAMLKLAGVAAGDAVLATFAYRLFSYWLPLPLGMAGFVAHRRRYRTAA